jgi:hypothetical protein
MMRTVSERQEEVLLGRDVARWEATARDDGEEGKRECNEEENNDCGGETRDARCETSCRT